MQTDEKELRARILDGHAEDFGYFLERYSQEAFAIVVRLVPQQEDAEASHHTYPARNQYS